MVAWLAQQMAKTQITRVLRIGWATVGQIVNRVVADQLDERRLSGLVAIGCDEISYRRGQRYPTSVVDHETGAIVCCAACRNAQPLQGFFDELGERKQTIRAVSIDMAGGYEKAIRENAPRAEVCFQPVSCGASRAARRRPGPSRRVDRPRPLPHEDRQVDVRTPAGRCSRAPRSRRFDSSRRERDWADRGVIRSIAADDRKAARQPIRDLQPEGLRLRPCEVDFIPLLGPLLPTPRAAKKLVNLYRLIRIGIRDDQLAEFVGDESSGPYQVLLVLLAITVGTPDLARPLLMRIASASPTRTSSRSFTSSGRCTPIMGLCDGTTSLTSLKAMTGR